MELYDYWSYDAYFQTINRKNAKVKLSRIIFAPSAITYTVENIQSRVF